MRAEPREGEKENSYLPFTHPIWGVTFDALSDASTVQRYPRHHLGFGPSSPIHLFPLQGQAWCGAHRHRGEPLCWDEVQR